MASLCRIGKYIARAIFVKKRKTTKGTWHRASLDGQTIFCEHDRFKDKCEKCKATDVHTEHCCIFHGCKYGYDDCTVVTKIKKQSFPCEECASEYNEGDCFPDGTGG